MSGWSIQRADIAWNFDLPARALIVAHSTLSVPGIHGVGTLWKGGQGVTWTGANSRFGVKLYDKPREMDIPGSVLRAEVSLRSDHLRRHLRGNDWRNFDTLYAIYRGIMAGIPAIAAPAGKGDWQEAIGRHLPCELRTLVLADLAHKSERTLREYRRRIEAAAAQLPATFSWATQLPPDGPPPAVHVVPRNPSARPATE
ncbi:MAG: hypothetical protein WCK55_17700 [Verrucomicrobiota bacterium]